VKLWIRSDLHCSLDALTTSFEDAPEHDVAVLAGDIWSSIDKQIRMLDSITEKPVVVVAGNHEFDAKCLPIELMAAEVAAKRAGRRVRFLERSATVIQGVRFVGGTMWTDLNLYGSDARSFSMSHAQVNGSEFKSIYNDLPDVAGMPRLPFSPEDARRIHLQTREKIEEVMAQPFDGPTVVVTHHAPSKRSIAERWQGDVGSPAFASDLTGFIERLQPALWIHGHVHDSFDYSIGKTRVICNPAGFEGENPRYDPNLIVEV
jgi:Icc-related predicted phosphoesterase